MSGIVKRAARSVSVFLLASLSCIALLLLVCKIPQSAIEENSRLSAQYLVKEDAFPLVAGRLIGSRGDNYADSNLLNVIYHVDSDRAFYSLIASPYYRVEGESAQENYHDTVVLSLGPNADYARYWHGSQVLIRPLLVLTSVKGIRLALFALLIALNLWLIARLLRQGQRYAAIIYIAGLLLTGFWMTAFSLEYIMTFLVMTAACIGVSFLCRDASAPKGDSPAACRAPVAAAQARQMTALFIVSGVVTCFLDFLTTETLTFTVPYLLYLFLLKSQDRLGTLRRELSRMAKWGAAWLASYAAMFAIKWGLIGVTLGTSAFADALRSAAVRMDGSILAAGLSAGEAGSRLQQMSGALLRNLACLFPVTTDVSKPAVLMLTWGVLAVSFAVFYLLRKDPVDGRLIALLALTAAIPYARFLCLSNHSYIHYFFAYRAQMAAVMALGGMLLFSIRPGLKAASSAGKTRKRRKNIR